MDRYCVMGNPVAHSRSPWIHARFAELTGQTLAYERQLAPLDGFAATVQAFRSAGGRGCNVTVPFKHEAAALASWQSPGVALAGAANTLHFDGDAIRAHNTDGPGLVADIIHNAGVPLAGQEVLLIGAGGAAAGVLGPLIGQRPRRIVIANRTRSRADALVQRHAALAPSTVLRCRPAGWTSAPTLAQAGRRLRRGDQRHRQQPGRRRGTGAPIGAEARRAGAGHDVRPRRAGLSWTGPPPTARCRATAWACWWSRPPKPS